ncbi:MAG: DUF2256 domain-containing protein [Pirellulales bacterium]
MKKENLPEKTCVVCSKSMTWRRKWSRVWEDVKHCSELCRRRGKSLRCHTGENNLRLDA